MIESYIKNQIKKAAVLSAGLSVLLGGYYVFEISAIESSSSANLKIKNAAAEISRLQNEKKMLSDKIEKLSILDTETAKLLAEQKKYEMDPQKEKATLIEIFNMVSNEYGLFNVIVTDVSSDSDFLNLLNVKLVVSSNDTAGLGEEARLNYTKKMRELVVLYLYKNRAFFSLYKDVEKIGNDTVAFKIIKR